MTEYAIRAFHLSDLTALYRICLLTGAQGSDASTLYGDPDLLGHFYAAPYAVLEPDLCFVLTHNHTPCGYVLGTRDGQQFHDRCERDWFPPLRARYPLPPTDNATPDAHIIRLIHRGHVPNPDLHAYPAHLHIDLLPHAQGQGWGRALITTFVDRLRALNVPAVHLGVGTGNPGAIAFYERVGFRRLQEHAAWIAFGMNLEH